MKVLGVQLFLLKIFLELLKLFINNKNIYLINSRVWRSVVESGCSVFMGPGSINTFVLYGDCAPNLKKK